MSIAVLCQFQHGVIQTLKEKTKTYLPKTSNFYTKTIPKGE